MMAEQLPIPNREETEAPLGKYPLALPNRDAC